MKKNIKKYLLMALSLVLVSAISIVGTIAYLMDTDSALNTFTVGNVDISLKEDVGVIGEGADYVQTENGTEYTGVMPGDYLKKTVTVTNEGNTPAYVAVTVTVNNALEINKAIDEVYEAKGYTPEQIQGIYDIVFDGWGLNYNKVDADGNALGMRLTITDEDMPEGVEQVDSVKTLDEYWQQYSGNWFMDTKTVIPFNGYYTTGMNKYELRYTYYMLLEEKGETVTLFNGLNVPEVFNKEQLAMFEGLNINIEAAAIQADNFSDAKVAFATLKQEMADGQNDGDVGAFVVPISNADGLVEALEAGKDVELVDDVIIDPANMSNAYGKTGINVKNGQTIDGNGKTLNIKGAGGTWDSGINTTGGTIKNITVTGSFRGIFVNHNSTYSAPVVLDNVTIKGTTYTISCDQGMYQNLIATNSKFYGWTSYAATLGTASFTDCTFGYGNGYKYMRPYCETTYTNCVFEEGYQIDARATCTFYNCKIGDTLITAENIATLVTSNTANAVVK